MGDMTVLREIAPSASVAPEANIGLFCVIGPNVTIGPGTVMTRRICVLGHTIIGSGNVIGEGTVLGTAPQDMKYAGGPTVLTIGHRNRFGRNVSVQPGTEFGGCLTRIGDDNVLLDGSHIAHDCYVDDHVHLGRCVLLAGHIRVESGAVIDDQTGIHHFVTVGRWARVGQRTPVRRDVPPYTNFYGQDYEWAAPPAVRGIHEEGVRGANLSQEEEKELRRALSELFDDESALQTKIEQLVNLGVEGEAARLCEFCQRSLRGTYGRHRESYRGEIPPEAQKYLEPELLKNIQRGAT